MTPAAELRDKADKERPAGGWCVRTEPFKDQMLVAVSTQAFSVVVAVPQSSWDALRYLEIIRPIADQA